MKVKVFLLLSFILSSIVHAQTTQTGDLQHIRKTILSSPKDTLVLFDVDFVLIRPKDTVFIKQLDPDYHKFVRNFYKRLNACLENKDVAELRSIIFSSIPSVALTPDTPKVVQEIQSKGYKTLGLTMRGTGQFGRISSMEDWRINDLKSVGISFKNGLPDVAAGKLDSTIHTTERENDLHICSPAAVEGVLFTCAIPKGEVLRAYLDYIKVKPKRVIMVDDIAENIQTVSDYCVKNKIEFTGFEYTAAKEQAKLITIDKSVAKLQFAVLEVSKLWLSDEQAKHILSALN